MKTLANCAPVEFLRQTNKIRHQAGALLKNLDEMMDALLEKDPESTVQLLGMLCFMEPEEALAANGMELFNVAMELLNSKAVLGFLSSLMNLAR